MNEDYDCDGCCWDCAARDCRGGETLCEYCGAVQDADVGETCNCDAHFAKEAHDIEREINRSRGLDD